MQSDERDHDPVQKSLDVETLTWYDTDVFKNQTHKVK